MDSTSSKTRLPGLDQTRVMANDGSVSLVDPDQFLRDIRDGFEKFCHGRVGDVSASL